MSNIEIINPKTYLDSKCKNTIYLAGPIVKEDNWQKEAIQIIEHNSNRHKKIYILNPFDKLNTERGQREWEYYHQNISSKNGTILFWFPEGAEITAQNSENILESLLDLGYWTSKKESNSKLKLSIGWDIQFYRNELLMQHINLINTRINPKDTLEETCVHALESLNRRY
jgi:hypothetical protein